MRKLHIIIIVCICQAPARISSSVPRVSPILRPAHSSSCRNAACPASWAHRTSRHHSAFAQPPPPGPPHQIHLGNILHPSPPKEGIHFPRMPSCNYSDNNHCIFSGFFQPLPLWHDTVYRFVLLLQLYHPPLEVGAWVSFSFLSSLPGT